MRRKTNFLCIDARTATTTTNVPIHVHRSTDLSIDIRARVCLCYEKTTKRRKKKKLNVQILNRSHFRKREGMLLLSESGHCILTKQKHTTAV